MHRAYMSLFLAPRPSIKFPTLFISLSPVLALVLRALGVQPALSASFSAHRIWSPGNRLTARRCDTNASCACARARARLCPLFDDPTSYYRQLRFSLGSLFILHFCFSYSFFFFRARSPMRIIVRAAQPEKKFI